MGADDAPHLEDGEGPVRSVRLTAFAIAAHAVSNAQFAEFVQATGYVTTAERRGRSHVFYLHLDQPEMHPSPLADAPWWRNVSSASWRHPHGAEPAVPEHPVVHVSYADALAYCSWAGARLPSEAEWECAAQGGDAGPINIWKGGFPDTPAGKVSLHPVASGLPNLHGLYHTCGNVWEWTEDGFGRLHSPRPVQNPCGNLGAVRKVVKGGSYLCAPSYCARFRPSSRRSEHPNATTDHLGFRVAAL